MNHKHLLTGAANSNYVEQIRLFAFHDTHWPAISLLFQLRMALKIWHCIGSHTWFRGCTKSPSFFRLSTLVLVL